MTKHPTDAALRDALVLAEKATPGPWHVSSAVTRGGFTFGEGEVLTKRGVVVLAWSGYDGADGTKTQRRRNLAFLAAARTGWPAAAEALLATRAALPDPKKLELLADWFDAYDERTAWKVIAGETVATEVQKDLRLWAAKARAVLGELTLEKETR